MDFAAGADLKPSERPVPAAEMAEKLAAAEAAGYQRGFAAAQAQQKAEIDRRNAASLESIARALDGLNQALAAVEGRLEAETVDVAVAVGRKLAAELMTREPLAGLQQLASECFQQLVSAPHIVVRVNDALFEAAREKLDALAQARGYEGRLAVLGDPDIAPGDCRIEWADGGVRRERAAIDAAIDEAVKRYLAARLMSGADPIWRFNT
jgi:flagellar assembly protein FliH